METKDENIVMIPTENQFCLTKAKVTKDGGLDVHYEVTEVIGAETYRNKYHVESAKDIHPDLARQFKILAPIMARVLNISSFLSCVDSPDFKATRSQKDLARDYSDSLIGNIDIRGVSLSGNDDNVAVIITSVYKIAGNLKTCINSPRLKFNTETFGFEEELEDIVDTIEKEVYLFLFKGKKAQGELFTADGNAADANTDDQPGLFGDDDEGFDDSPELEDESDFDFDTDNDNSSDDL